MDEKFVKNTIIIIMKYLNNNLGPGMSNLNEITSNIYCSDYNTACNAEILNDNRIYTVISLGDSKSTEVLNEYKKRKIHNVQFTIEDNPRQNMADVFLETYNIIKDTVSDGRKILIHCNAGVSRSSSVIIAYLIRRQYLISYKKYKVMLDENDADMYKNLQDLSALNTSKLLGVIKFIKRARPCICPNPGFVQQLFLYERYLKSHITTALDHMIQHDATVVKKKKKEQLKNNNDIPDEPVLVKLSRPSVYRGKHQLSELTDLEISDEEPLDNSDVIDTMEFQLPKKLNTLLDTTELQLSKPQLDTLIDFDLDF